MGNNDFIAGDPWGLPIEDSEDAEAETARPENDAPQPNGHGEEGKPEEDVDLDVNVEDQAVFETPEDRDAGPTPDEESAGVETDTEPDGWLSTIEEPVSTEVRYDTPREEGEAVEEEDAADEDAYEFRAPSRTPLSQMIAAAQSVVSSVQGDQAEETDEVDGSESGDGEPLVVSEVDSHEEFPPEDGTPLEDPWVDHSTPEPALESAYAQPDPAAGNDDLPEEPPSWLIVDTEPDGDQSGTSLSEEAVESGNRHGADDDRSFTPGDIETSMQGLAAPEPAEVPFAEDRFAMGGEEQPETDHEFGAVDMDSSPGVYSELHDLSDQDEQAEALLQEAAEAFGRTDHTTIEPLDEDLQELTEDLAPSPTDIDSYADALATELGTDHTTIEPLDENLQELTTGDGEGFEDLDALDPLSDLELGAALAGLAETSPDDLASGSDGSLEVPEEEAIGAGWWGEDPEPAMPAIPVDEPFEDEAISGIAASVEPAAEEEAVGAGWWEVAPEPGGPAIPVDEPFEDEAISGIAASVEPAAEEPEPAAVSLDEEDGLTEDSYSTLEADAEATAAQTGPTVIDSPVEWGTRYREAHQGWVEDDEGRSTWRPIVTSGESVAGWDVDIYLGLVSGDVAIDPGSAESVATEVTSAREEAVRSMLDEALARGAHAVVGVAFSIQDVAGTVLVAASGVAVTLRTPA